ncbi:50S ribosomal protein L19 [Bienertia sinuspersici]
MASAGSSMWLSFLLFTVVLSLEVIYRGKLASSELFTILGGSSEISKSLVVLELVGVLLYLPK